MNNETLSNFKNQIINDERQRNLRMSFLFAPLTLLIYASLFSFPDEIEHIWKRKFTLPTYLYLFTKYSLLVFLPLAIVADLAPLSLRHCDVVDIVAGVGQTFSSIGFEGLIVIQTYTLSQGYRPMAVVLPTLFLIFLTTQIYALTSPLCVAGPSPSSLLVRLFFIQGVAIILLNAFAFITTIYQVWGSWRSKRSLKQPNNGFLTLLLQQGAISFCFVLFSSTAQIILSLLVPAIATIFASLQITLTSLIICKFMLDLRCNANKSTSNQSGVRLPTVSSQGLAQSVRVVLGRLHESIMAEMGERNSPPPRAIDTDGPVSREPGDLENGLGLDGANSDMGTDLIIEPTRQTISVTNEDQGVGRF